MYVSIYSLKKVLFEDEATAINCQTEAGEITVLDHHAPLVTVLKKGVIKILNANKKEQFINASSGFLEVNSKNQAKLIIDQSGEN